MKVRKVKDMTFRYGEITICYATNGHRLYQGPVSNIPEHLLEYYCGYRINNKYRKSHYIEVTEDEKFFI